MKSLARNLMLIVLMCSTVAIKANDYVMLSPLDTAALPAIPRVDRGGNLVRSVLEKNAMWDNVQKQLSRHHFSEKCVMKMMKKMYGYTHKHYVSFPVAYWSQNAQGDSLLVSGRVYLPKRRYLNGIVIANHYTMTADKDVPSNMLSMESLLVMKGYAVLLPDYVGYGLSREEIHPYLHWRSAAQTAVDLLDCMPPLLDYLGYSYSHDVVVMGYSQGAAVALGVARMLEEQADTSDWTVRKLYAGAGPYDPATTYVYSISHGTMGIPVAIPLIVLGLGDAYSLAWQPEDFFREPLLSNYQEWILSKQYGVAEINDRMGSNRMAELMTTEALDLNSSLAKMLYDALQWNSNVGYDLQAPAYFLHSLDDQVVPLINTELLQSEMPENDDVRYDIGHYGSHFDASIPFMKYVYQDL